MVETQSEGAVEVSDQERVEALYSAALYAYLYVAQQTLRPAPDAEAGIPAPLQNVADLWDKFVSTELETELRDTVIHLDIKTLTQRDTAKKALEEITGMSEEDFFNELNKEQG